MYVSFPFILPSQQHFPIPLAEEEEISIAKNATLKKGDEKLGLITPLPPG